MKLILYRFDEYSDGQGTPGEVLTESGAHVCFMMELPDRGNARSVSRILPGAYRLSVWNSRKFPRSMWVHDTPGRDAILIHGGNWAGDEENGWKTHSLGCLLPCTRHGSLNGQLGGLASQPALRKLMGLNPTELEIIQ